MRRLTALLILVCLSAPGAAWGIHLAWGPQRVLALGASGDCNPGLFPDGSGRWWACGRTAEGELFQLMGIDGSLNGPPVLAPNSGTRRAVVVADNGLAVAWTSGAGVYTGFLSGGTFTEPTVLSSVTDAQGIGLAATPTGFIACWQRGTYLDFMPLSTALQPALPLPTHATGNLLAPPAFCPVPGDLAVAWIEQRAGGPYLAVACLRAGRLWSLALPAGSQASPLLAAAEDGSLWVGWLPAGSSAVKVMRLSSTLTPIWAEPVTLPADAPWTLCGRNEDLLVAATTPDGLRAWCLDASGGQAWAEPALVADAGTPVACATTEGWWLAWLYEGEISVGLWTPEGMQRDSTIVAGYPCLEPPAMAPVFTGVLMVYPQPSGNDRRLAAVRVSWDDTPPPSPRVQAPEPGYIGPACPGVLTWETVPDPETGTIGCILRFGERSSGMRIELLVPGSGARNLADEPSLLQGGVYDFQFSALNSVGLESTAVALGPYTFDAQGPALTVAMPSGSLRGLVTVTAQAQEPVSPPARLALLLDGQQVATGTGSVSWDWDTRCLQVREGEHLLTFRAIDEAGNESTVERMVVVDNTTFDDVPKTSPYWRVIEAVYREGISGGCSRAPMLFCPEAPVTREQMAVFLCRAAGLTPVSPVRPTFADVTASRSTFGYVEALVAAGITSGCRASGGLRYFCPTAVVSREQMAVFLCRAASLGTWRPSVPTFADVPASSPAWPYVEALYRSGVTGGCATGPLRFCPAAAVTRAQMASFLCRAFGIAV